MKANKNIVLKLLFILTIVVLTSCRSDGQCQENDMPLVEAPEERAMPKQLLEENISQTDFTAVVIVKKARILGKPSWPFESQGYVNHIYEAEVLETIKGETGNLITYSVMAEAATELSLPSYPLIVSLCEAEGNSFYMPDNGYGSAASDSLVKYARKLPSSLDTKQKVKSVCKAKE